MIRDGGREGEGEGKSGGNYEERGGLGEGEVGKGWVGGYVCVRDPIHIIFSGEQPGYQGVCKATTIFWSFHGA